MYSSHQRTQAKYPPTQPPHNILSNPLKNRNLLSKLCEYTREEYWCVAATRVPGQSIPSHPTSSQYSIRPSQILILTFQTLWVHQEGMLMYSSHQSIQAKYPPSTQPPHKTPHPSQKGLLSKFCEYTRRERWCVAATRVLLLHPILLYIVDRLQRIKEQYEFNCVNIKIYLIFKADKFKYSQGWSYFIPVKIIILPKCSNQSNVSTCPRLSGTYIGCSKAFIVTMTFFPYGWLQFFVAIISSYYNHLMK